MTWPSPSRFRELPIRLRSPTKSMRSPRIGVGADFTFASIEALQTGGAELPEISRDRFDDPGPVAALADGVYAASTTLPEIYKLDVHGRVLGSWYVAGLLDDRPGNPSLISALLPLDDGVQVIQQAGWWPNASAKSTRLKLTASGAQIVERKTLPGALNWLVGAASYKSTFVGMTDDGHLYDLTTAKELGIIALPDPADTTKRQNRFAGPIVLDGRLTVYDRTNHVLLQLGDDAKGRPVLQLPRRSAQFCRQRTRPTRRRLGRTVATSSNAIESPPERDVALSAPLRVRRSRPDAARRGASRRSGAFTIASTGSIPDVTTTTFSPRTPLQAAREARARSAPSWTFMNTAARRTAPGSSVPLILGDNYLLEAAPGSSGRLRAGCEPSCSRA